MNPHTSSPVVADDVDYAKKEKFTLSEKRNEDEKLMTNIGIQGPRLPNPADFVNQNRRLER